MLSRRTSITITRTTKRGKIATNYIGERFGRLLVIKRVANTGKDKRYVTWECICDCGTVSKKRSADLSKSDGTKSCGCILREIVSVMGKANSVRLLKEPRLRTLSAYRCNASNRGYEWSLTDEEFMNLTSGDCHYCGDGPKPTSYTMNPSKRVRHFDVNGIDRVDNTIGYTTKNSVSCCKTCNRMKNAYTVEYMLSHMQKIISHSVPDSKEEDIEGT